jgi:hypothetical protein
MEHSEGQETPDVEHEEIQDRKVPHVLFVQFPSVQHAFEFPSREEAVKLVRTALERGWVEIENPQTYLLVLAGPSSGIGFIVRSKADVMAQQIEQQRAMQAAAQQQQGKRLVLPNGR